MSSLDVPPPAGGVRAPARTLLDIFDATVARHGDAVALDAADERLTYRELATAAAGVAARLREQGIGPGDRVGIRLASGTADLYVAILGTLRAGAAYVPVDRDDPEARALAVWEAAEACAVLEDGGAPRMLLCGTGCAAEADAGDDAWIIFTSGSTGAPKGVAVSHGAAAAFVDAEAQLWTVAPGDRVLAGLSVAFDASCEEMWLAWANGAALVPAPRAIVRSGTDLGPWLRASGVTVVSTVPTLAAMWDARDLNGVRLLILGGEACTDELGWRLAAGREVWNTYGPTEATVVTTAARIQPGEPVRIGRPLCGWEIAVVDTEGVPVRPGEPGELVIGGAGLARYLDPDLDAERFRALPARGWERAYRSGDLVCETPGGLAFLGRRDHQVKLGGRRLELGEVETHVASAPGVRAAVATVQQTAAGNPVLVAYVAGTGLRPELVAAHAAERLADGLAPLIVCLDRLPVTTAGKVDRAALPWPPPGAPADPLPDGTAAWLAERWREQLGPVPLSAESDFFCSGGSSLAAAKLVSVLRTRFPAVAVADVYHHRTLGALADRLDALAVPAVARR